MKSIYVHLSPDKFSFSNELTHSDFTYSGIPEYAKYSFDQTEKFLKEKPILLTNENITEDYVDEINSFYEICKQGFPSFYRDPFWLTTLIRLYVVYLYCRENNINEFIHLEYDNLIYSDFKQLSKLPPAIYFTRVGPYCSSAGFVYCNSLEKFEKFIKHLIKLLNVGELAVSQVTPFSFLSEMILIDIIGRYDNSTVKYLPILPFEPANDNFTDLQTLYDGASYGQFLGGTNNGAGPGWAERHHYIGDNIISNKLQVFFNSQTKMPYVKYNNEIIPIANLHIHSKNLKQFC